jgi:hypothetical protein
VRVHRTRGGAGNPQAAGRRSLAAQWELTQLNVSFADQRQAIEEQEATVLGLQQAAEVMRKALEAEKKRVEGDSPFACLLLIGSTCLGSAPNSCFSFMVFRPADRPRELNDPG